MSDDPNEDRNKSFFDHQGFDYKGGVRLREFHANPTWLPYWERLALVLWLAIYGAALQSIIRMPLSVFQRFVVFSFGIWFALLGMGMALRRADHRPAIGYMASQRRRRLTIIFTTLGMTAWIFLIYLVVR